jgi:LEA14-like dessication related protein
MKIIPFDHALKLFLTAFLFALLLSGCATYEAVELRQIKSVVADVTDHPTLKAEALFYNPNKQVGKLKSVHVDVYVEGKKAASINQRLKIKVPSRGEFSVPLEIKLNLKEQGLMNTVLSVLGAKKMKMRYQGYIVVGYHGLPVRIAVDHEESVRIKF